MLTAHPPRRCGRQILDNFLKKNVGPHALREVRSAINRARTLSGDSSGHGSVTREIRMTTVSTRRDDEQLLLSATPPDVEQDAVALAMAARAAGSGSPASHHRGSFSGPEFSPVPTSTPRL